MARPERNTVDYFPFYCDEGKKMFYLEETYGNDGFATFLKILRELAKTDYHFLDLSKVTTMMFLSAKCKVSKEILESIIKDLVDLDKFNRLLWEENRVIWCQDFIDSIQDAYSKRKNECISYESLLTLLIGLGVRKQSKRKNITPVNPQRKEKNSIVKKTKEEETKEEKVIPPIEEFINYGLDKGEELNLTIDVTKLKSKYLAWESNKWRTGKDRKITNWKTTLLNTLTYLQEEKNKEKTTGRKTGSQELRDALKEYTG